MRRTQTSRKRAILDRRKLCGELHCINVVDGGVPYCDEHRRGRTASTRRTGHKKVQAFRDMILWRSAVHAAVPAAPAAPSRSITSCRSPTAATIRQRICAEFVATAIGCARPGPPGRPPASPCSRERRHPPWATAVRSRQGTADPRDAPWLRRSAAHRRSRRVRTSMCWPLVSVNLTAGRKCRRRRW